MIKATVVKRMKEYHNTDPRIIRAWEDTECMETGVTIEHGEPALYVPADGSFYLLSSTTATELMRVEWIRNLANIKIV
jgi:hypothetical protein